MGKANISKDKTIRQLTLEINRYRYLLSGMKNTASSYSSIAFKRDFKLEVESLRKMACELNDRLMLKRQARFRTGRTSFSVQNRLEQHHHESRPPGSIKRPSKKLECEPFIGEYSTVGKQADL
jgi:hypothetical protein